MSELVESSMNFDLEHVEPFLRRVSALVDSGFGASEIAKVVGLAKSMAHDDEQELTFAVRSRGNEAELRVRAFMDDISAPDLYFFSPPDLAARIDAELKRFAEENDM